MATSKLKLLAIASQSAANAANAGALLETVREMAMSSGASDELNDVLRTARDMLRDHVIYCRNAEQRAIREARRYKTVDVCGHEVEMPVNWNITTGLRGIVILNRHDWVAKTITGADEIRVEVKGHPEPLVTFNNTWDAMRWVVINYGGNHDC